VPSSTTADDTDTAGVKLVAGRNTYSAATGPLEAADTVAVATEPASNTNTLPPAVTISVNVTSYTQRSAKPSGRSTKSEALPGRTPAPLLSIVQVSDVEEHPEAGPAERLKATVAVAPSNTLPPDPSSTTAEDTDTAGMKLVAARNTYSAATGPLAAADTDAEATEPASNINTLPPAATMFVNVTS